MHRRRCKCEVFPNTQSLKRKAKAILSLVVLLRVPSRGTSCVFIMQGTYDLVGHGIVCLRRWEWERKKNKCYHRKSWAGWMFKMIHLDPWLRWLNEFLQHLLIKLSDKRRLFCPGCNHLEPLWLLCRNNCQFSKWWFRDWKVKEKSHLKQKVAFGFCPAQASADQPIKDREYKHLYKHQRLSYIHRVGQNIPRNVEKESKVGKQSVVRNSPN